MFNPAMYSQGTLPNDAVYQQHMLQTTAGYVDSLPAHMSLPQTVMPSSSSNLDMPAHVTDTSIDNQDDDGDAGGKRRRVQRACDVGIRAAISQTFLLCSQPLTAGPSHLYFVSCCSSSNRLAARRKSVATAFNQKKALAPIGTLLLALSLRRLSSDILTSSSHFAHVNLHQRQLRLRVHFRRRRT